MRWIAHIEMLPCTIAGNICKFQWVQHFKEISHTLHIVAMYPATGNAVFFAVIRHFRTTTAAFQWHSSGSWACDARATPTADSRAPRLHWFTYTVHLHHKCVCVGRHNLKVKVRGEEIEGSPFRVFIKFPLSTGALGDQTCKPVV